jgi:hypothetical protein
MIFLITTSLRAPSQLHHFLGLEAFGSLGHLELDLLALFQGLEAFALNGGVMDEHISAAVVPGEEAIAPLLIEPPDNSLLSHNRTSFGLLIFCMSF